MIELILNENRLETIDRRLFQGLKKLKTLGLRNNKELIEIDYEIFEELIELESLELDDHLHYKNNNKNRPTLFRPHINKI